MTGRMETIEPGNVTPWKLMLCLSSNLLAGSIPERLLGGRKYYAFIDHRTREYIVANALDVLDVRHSNKIAYGLFDGAVLYLETWSS
eukprot:3098274-Amphidinium_carterae.1